VAEDRAIEIDFKTTIRGRFAYKRGEGFEREVEKERETERWMFEKRKKPDIDTAADRSWCGRLQLLAGGFGGNLVGR